MQAHPLQGRGSETWPGASRDFSRAGWGPSALHHADSPHPNPSPEGEGLETEKNMTLRGAVQMDPMDNINIGGDSSFALILKALERGYESTEEHTSELQPLMRCSYAVFCLTKQ